MFYCLLDPLVFQPPNKCNPKMNTQNQTAIGFNFSILQSLSIRGKKGTYYTYRHICILYSATKQTIKPKSSNYYQPFGFPLIS
jgi:hypothetical protein